MPGNTIYSRFKAQAARRPEANAIVSDDGAVSYARLDAMADAILARLGKRRHKAIGIVMEHGPMQVAAMLAVLKSGAAYIPAEPSLPQQRTDYMMRTAGASLVIDDSFCRDLTPDAHSNTPDRSRPDGAAYILFTSGTTGRPKGVIIENHSVVNYCDAFRAEMQTGPGDVMLQLSVCSFDIFVEEVFATLLCGATLAIPPAAIRNGGVAGIMAFAARHGATIVDGFPYLIADINRRPALLPESVRLIISGGDVVRASYISNLRRPNLRIYNTYGPSETTVCSNYCRIDNRPPLSDGTFPIGKPVGGVEVRILDPALREVAPGAEGEICIFGEGVARGYTGNPPEQANFAIAPDGRRFYRSGDMGRVLPDGNMAFLHRRDDQVMILGRRVEPEEVENVLNSCAMVERGVVRAFTDSCGLRYLVAYIVEGSRFSLHALKEFLYSRLADFMIPEYFVAMKSIPLTLRGKVDYSALPLVLKEGDYR